MCVKSTVLIGTLLLFLLATAVLVAQTYQPDDPVPPGSVFRIIDLKSRIIDLESRVIDLQFRVEAAPEVGTHATGKASGPHSTMSSDFLYLPANPDAVATLTIRVADAQGQPVPGKRVQVKSALSGGPVDTIIQPEAPTDARGITTARIKPISPPHSARFSASVLEDNVDVGQNVEIEVQTAGPPSFFPPSFASYLDANFIVSPMPLKVGQLTTFKVPLTNRRKVPVEICVRFFGAVPNIGLGLWPKIGETELFVLKPGESREAKVTWTPTVASKLCAKVEVWGRELPQQAVDDGTPRLIAVANAQTPAQTPKAGEPSKMDSKQQNLGTVAPQKKCDNGHLCEQLGSAVKAVKKGIHAKRDQGIAAVKAPFKSNAVKALENVKNNGCTNESLSAAIDSMVKSLTNLKEKPANTAEVVENNRILKKIVDELRTMIEAKCAVASPPVGPCPVAPLAPLSADAQKEEDNPRDESKLTQDMKSALDCLRAEWKSAGRGGVSVTSGYRSTEYQRHLYNLWKKYVQLLRTRNPACAALQDEIFREMKKHGVIGQPLNPDSASAPQHPAGKAIDVAIPKENTQEFLSSAACCNLYRPWPNDPVHFEVCPSGMNCRENCAQEDDDPLNTLEFGGGL